MHDFTIRLETEQDHRAVEELTREAFWNVYKPGADEHYFVHQASFILPETWYNENIKKWEVSYV